MMTKSPTEIDKVVSSFHPTKISPDTVPKLAQLIQVYDISLDDLVNKWQAILFSKFNGDSSIELDNNSFSLLQQKVLDSVQKSFPKSHDALHSPNHQNKRKKKFGLSSFDKTTIHSLKNELSGSALLSQKDAIHQIPKQNTIINSSSAPNSQNAPFSEDKTDFYKTRQNSNKVELTLTDQKNSIDTYKSNSQLSIHLVPNSYYGRLIPTQHFALEASGLTSSNFRYMVDSVSDRSDFLEMEADYLASIVKLHYDIKSLNNPRYTTSEDVFVVGRIVASSENSYKLSPTSVELATSRRLGSGPSIPFPEKLHRKFIKEDLLGGFDMISACGPYTTLGSFSTNSYFEPLADLAKRIIDSPPKLVVLAGPFISEQIVQFDIRLVRLTPDQIFKDYIAPLLNSIALVSKLILVPSCDDLISPIINFPAPELPKQRLLSLGLDRQILSVPNPSQLIVNGFVISISIVDSLVALSGSELGVVSPNSVQKPRMERLAYHLLEQHSFFPVDPVPYSIAPISHTVLLNESRVPVDPLSKEDLHHLELFRSEDQDTGISPTPISVEKDEPINVDPASNSNPEADVELLGSISPIHMVHTPDILISPSQLKACAFYICSEIEKSQKCLFTNPGKLSSGKMGGTFSYFKISESHSSVEIIRI
ncbi:DNA polymerase alpha subunit B [Smittium mucronatum]|uniref:DNA polymerase alpha subunit B n=1 Tax=Smittium mucronatum TaxID=133383 RepID=A0A1R0GMQ5_9FUNG|nr:DNA polymerase alpha subunit B [Smittium mucronatum]